LKTLNIKKEGGESQKEREGRRGTTTPYKKVVERDI